MDDTDELIAAMLAVAPDPDALARLADYSDHGGDDAEADDTEPG
jgi:hypothetical protein